MKSLVRVVAAHMGPAVVVFVSSLGVSSVLADSVTIQPGDFAASATAITFEETGTTELPVVPGVSFPYDIGKITPVPPHYLAGIAGSAYVTRSFDPAFGYQAYMNLVGSEGYSDLAVIFDSPVEAIGGWLGRCECADTAHFIDFRILDAGGSVLGHQVVILPVDENEPLIFAGLSSSGGIRRAEWRIVGDVKSEGGFTVDNLTFGSIASVPAPPVAWIFGAAIGLSFWRRNTAYQVDVRSHL